MILTAIASHTIWAGFIKNWAKNKLWVAFMKTKAYKAFVTLFLTPIINGTSANLTEIIGGVMLAVHVFNGGSIGQICYKTSLSIGSSIINGAASVRNKLVGEDYEIQYLENGVNKVKKPQKKATAKDIAPGLLVQYLETKDKPKVTSRGTSTELLML